MLVGIPPRQTNRRRLIAKLIKISLNRRLPLEKNRKSCFWVNLQFFDQIIIILCKWTIYYLSWKQLYLQIVRQLTGMLVTGTGECGKSTFIKQMRIILGGGFPDDQYEYYLRVVHKNLHQAGASLATAMKTLSITYQNQVQQLYRYFFNYRCFILKSDYNIYWWVQYTYW